MKLLQVLLLAVLLAGCATDPYQRLEAETPTLSPAQITELRKNTVTLKPDTHGEERMATLATLPLLQIDTERPRDPGGRHRVPVVIGTVNGRAGVRLLIDSGSNQNLLGYRLARSLNIPLIGNIPPVISMGIGGAVDHYPALVPTLTIGSLEMRNLPALIGPDAQSLSLPEMFWRNPQMMIVSAAVFKRLSYLTIDGPRGTMIIAPGEPYLPPEDAKFVTDVALRWEAELPVVDLAVDKRGSFPCIVDTGGDYGLLLSRRRAAEFGYWKPGQGRLNTSRGVGGATLDTGFVVHQAKLGGATLENVPGRVLLIGPEPGNGKLLLGNVVLRQYRVTFDFRRRRLWLEK